MELASSSRLARFDPLSTNMNDGLHFEIGALQAPIQRDQLPALAPRASGLSQEALKCEHPAGCVG